MRDTPRGMTPARFDRLLKILALADSSHDGEAAAALRSAQQMLAREGLCFADLARGLAPPTAPLHLQRLDGQMQELRQRLALLQHATTQQQATLHEAQTTIHRLETQLDKSRAEVERWRNLARDTANQLWEIGRQIAADQHAAATVTSQVATSPVAAPWAERRTRASTTGSQALRQRRFVRNSLLEAQEINLESGKAE